MLKFLVAAMALLAVAGLTAVSAQEATPTPSPVPTSAITIRFVRDGQPVTILSGEPDRFADGVKCSRLNSLPGAGPIAGDLHQWPLVAGPDQSAECSKGPPTLIRFVYGGGVTVEILWTGSDMTVDAKVPPDFPGVGLPPTGGPPAEDSGEPRWFRLGLMAAGLMAASLGAMTWRRGRRAQ